MRGRQLLPAMFFVAAAAGAAAADFSREAIFENAEAREYATGHRTIQTYAGTTTSRRGSPSLDGYPPQLVEKVKELQAFCGARVISAYRPGARVRGSGVRSLHSVKRAVDVAGNPSCIYARLKSWPGGYSVDYHRIRPNHVHISYSPGGMEWGARFVHWQPRRYASRNGKSG